MAIKKDTLDQLPDGHDPKEVFNKDGLFDELQKALAERVLNAEIDDLDFLVNRGGLALLNTSSGELLKTFAILLMGSLVSRDLPPRHQRRASQ